MVTSFIAAPTFSSVAFTDIVISRNLQSCIKKAHTVNSSTKASFIRYASYAIELLDSRLDATEESWFPLLSKYNQEFGERAKAHEDLRQTSQWARETLHMVKDSKSADLRDDMPKALAKLWEEFEPIFNAEAALLNKIWPEVSREDMNRLEEEDKKRRLALMKKDGHLWCATYMMRSLTAEEREQFPPGVPNMAKSAMLMAGNWKFSKLAAAMIVMSL
jgi:hypothetical protein